MLETVEVFKGRREGLHLGVREAFVKDGERAFNTPIGELMARNL